MVRVLSWFWIGVSVYTTVGQQSLLQGVISESKPSGLYGESMTTSVKQKKYWQCLDCRHIVQQDSQPSSCSVCGGSRFYYYYQ